MDLLWPAKTPKAPSIHSFPKLSVPPLQTIGFISAILDKDGTPSDAHLPELTVGGGG